jgi:predicted amidohydrolase YtcJ
LLPKGAGAPAGAQVIDLSGKFIIPGLFDSHVHWEDYMGELYVNTELRRLFGWRTWPRPCG